VSRVEAVWRSSEGSVLGSWFSPLRSPRWFQKSATERASQLFVRANDAHAGGLASVEISPQTEQTRLVQLNAESPSPRRCACGQWCVLPMLRENNVSNPPSAAVRAIHFFAR